MGRAASPCIGAGTWLESRGQAVGHAVSTGRGGSVEGVAAGGSPYRGLEETPAGRLGYRHGYDGPGGSRGGSVSLSL